MNTNWNDPNFQGFGGKNPFGGRTQEGKGAPQGPSVRPWAVHC